MRITFDQVTAFAIVIICGILLGLGIDGEVKSILAMAGVWAFGRSVGNNRGKA